MKALGKWKIVAAPDGYRVHLFKEFDQYDDPRSLMQMAVEGIGEHGEPTTVRGQFVARVFRADWQEQVA